VTEARNAAIRERDALMVRLETITTEVVPQADSRDVRTAVPRDLVAHSEILPDRDPERIGLNEHEPFFDFVRAG